MNDAEAKAALTNLLTYRLASCDIGCRTQVRFQYSLLRCSDALRSEQLANISVERSLHNLTFGILHGHSLRLDTLPNLRSRTDELLQILVERLAWR